jgi:hypothetical protein
MAAMVIPKDWQPLLECPQERLEMPALIGWEQSLLEHDSDQIICYIFL